MKVHEDFLSVFRLIIWIPCEASNKTCSCLSKTRFLMPVTLVSENEHDRALM